jgi:hypothetical protein
MKQILLVLGLCAITGVSARAQEVRQAQEVRPAQACSEFEAPTGKPDWMLVSGPGVGGPMTPVNVTPYPGWANPIGSSSWVSVNAQRGSQAGDYTYEYTFCVCRKGELRLRFYADNGATVYLNGTQIFATTGNMNFTGPPKVVTNGAALVSGTNTLRIVVHNEGSVTGLDAVLNVTGANPGCCRR